MSKESKERVVYRFRYKDAPSVRNRMPFLERAVDLVREVRYGNGLRSYQLIGRYTKAEQLKLEEIIKEQFPKKIRAGTKDTLKSTINEWTNQIRSSE